MRTITRLLAVVVATALAGCGDSDATGPGPSNSRENVAGGYAGSIQGVSQGIAMDGVFALSIGQQGGSLSGTYSISGQLTDGIDVVAIAGAGALSGTISAGANPSVNLTVTPASCPARQATFSGTYDSANRRITLYGSIQITNQSCVVVLTYPSTVTLVR